MPKILKRTFISLALALGLMLPTLATVPAHAQIDPEFGQAACQGLSNAGQNCNEQNASSTIRNLLRNVINILSWAVGIISIIMMLIGSLKYVTSNGDSNSINSAKSTITYALVGVVVAAIAQVLVMFVLRQATQTGGQGGNSTGNICVVDEDGNFVSNPNPSIPCAM